MNKDILQKINALLKQKDDIPLEKLEALVQEMLEFFQNVSAVLKDGTEEEKKEAAELMLEVQGKFQELGLAVAKKMGLSPDQVQKMINPKDFLPEIKKEMEDKD